MPIKGLTDRGLAFPQIGAIRLGTKKVSAKGKEYPSDLTFFRVEFDNEEADAVAQFTEHYGGLDVTEINIMFPFNDIDRVWDVWLEAYTASRLWARSDGEYFQYLADPNGGEPLVVNGVDRDGNPMRCDPDQPVGKDNSGKAVYLKPTGRLKVVIPELVRGAYLVLRTGSYHNVANISQQLAGIQEVVGRIAGIPLVLRRRPKEISTPDDREKGKRVRREKWLVSIEISPTWMRERFGQSNLLGLPIGTRAPAAIPAHANGDNDPFEEYEDEGEVVEAEPVVEQVKPLPREQVANGGASIGWLLRDEVVDNTRQANALADALQLEGLDEMTQRDRVKLYQVRRGLGEDKKVAAQNAIDGKLPEADPETA